MAPVTSVDMSGLIPTQYSSQILEQAVLQSAVLALGTRVPIPTGKSSIPVPSLFPKAAFVTGGPGGRKPFTKFAFTSQEIVAEEIAATIAIPDSYLADSAINLWAYARPRLAESIGMVLDAAVFTGAGAPASYPVGGIVASATEAADGIDAIDTVNNAMALVEDAGLNVTGHAADIRVKSVFRGVRENTGALLLDREQVDSRQIDTLYGVPISWNTLLGDDFDFITGNWGCLMVGVRQDIQYKLSDSGVLVDDAGKVEVSAFQDNQTLLKVWARIGVSIVKPLTRLSDTPVNPFAYATLKPAGGSPLAVAARKTAAK